MLLFGSVHLSRYKYDYSQHSHDCSSSIFIVPWLLAPTMTFVPLLQQTAETNSPPEASSGWPWDRAEESSWSKKPC